MHIKSRLLLPVGEEEEGEEGEDPRQELVRQLLEYQRYKEASAVLGDLEERRSRVFAGGSIGPDAPARTDYPLEVSLLELLSALKKLLEKVPDEVPLEVQRERLSIAERINTLLERLKKTRGEVPFEELFEESSGVGDVIVTFLAILELMRLRMVRAWQAVPGERIMVTDIRPEGAEEDGEQQSAPGLENQGSSGGEDGSPRENGS
jgi:segregation and condensation protein A